jgi:hypothetical protein
MDIACGRCGEPSDADHLRHGTHHWICAAHNEVTRRDMEPADNGAVPPQVRTDLERGEPGWLHFVARGNGCSNCYGHADRQRRTDLPLTFAEVDDTNAATEGGLL